ncbi:MAG: type II secretion system protein GspD [Candidatus Sumerlaeia bacterium]
MTRFKTLILSILTVAIATAVISPALGQDEDDFWFGTVQSISFEPTQEGTENLVVEIKEDLDEMNVKEFDLENVYHSLVNEGKLFKLTLDGIFPGDWAGRELRSDLGNRCKVLEQEGFAEKEGQFFTRTDKPIKSTIIEYRSEKPIYYAFLPLEVKGDRVTIKIKINEAQPLDTTANGPGVNQDIIEVMRPDFDNPMPMNVFEMEYSQYMQTMGESDENDPRVAILRRLEGVPTNAFVTVYYPARNLSPRTLSDLVKHKLSVLGTITTEDDTAMLVITDYNSYVRAIIEALNRLDIRTPQVMIEVKIIELAYTDEKDIGAGVTFSSQSDEWASNFGSSLSPALDPNFPILSGGGTYMGVSDILQLNMMLNALIKKDRAKILARPRIMALNNERSSFKAGTKVPYVRRRSFSSSNQRDLRDSTTESSNRNLRWENESKDTSYIYDDPDFNNEHEYFRRSYINEQDNSSINKSISDNRSQSTDMNMMDDFMDIGIELSVTPHILNSRDIRLDIQPSYTEITGIAPGSNLPVLSNRELNNSVRVKDGETFLLGGLFREKTLKVKSRVPILGSIPIIKHLFTHTREEKKKTEIIFIIKVDLLS